MTTHDPLDSARLARKLFRGLKKRIAMPGGAAREGIDAYLIDIVGQLGASVHPQPLPDDSKPPRPIAVAFALALFSQPYISTLCRPGPAQKTESLSALTLRPPDRPIVLPVEVLSEVLGLDVWQLEELREEVDRRAGHHLLRSRALHWLWDHFGLPDGDAIALFRELFPALSIDSQRTGFVRTGGRLYALTDQLGGLHESSLYMSWHQDDDDHFNPVGTFQSRYIEPSLGRRLAQSIGTTDREALELLDRMVTILPRSAAERFLAFDQWRILGYESLTCLEGPWQEVDLSRHLPPDAFDPSELFTVEDGRIALVGSTTFDRCALVRAQLMTRQLYGILLTSSILDSERATGGRASTSDLEVYDLRTHLSRAMEPMFTWTLSPATVAHVARVLGTPRDETTEALRTLGESWRAHFDFRWIGEPSSENPNSIATLLARHLARTQLSLLTAFNRTTQLGLPHQDLLLLFAGHYFAEAPIHRVWRDTGLGQPADPLGEWFWRTWDALVVALDDEEHTSSTLELD